MNPPPEDSNPLPRKGAAEARVRQRIAEDGRITFAEFSETALYHPTDGYYTSHTAVGAEGDYFTSPQAHPAFGALLAIFLHGMWTSAGRPEPFHVVEMGAGNGRLARDFTAYASALCPGYERSLRYVALDRSVSGTGQEPFDRLISNTVPFEGVTGCLISNELLDSYPVHRFQIDRGVIKEVYVTIVGDELIETLDEPSTSLIGERLAALDRPLPDGFRGEVNPAIPQWARSVSDALHTGFIVTIDYGHPTGDLYSAPRSSGTVQTYRGHALGTNPYTRIGRQDITAHVDFGHVVDEGTAAGLRTLGLQTQAEMLGALGAGDMLAQLRDAGLSMTEYGANRSGIMELLKSDGLGGFRWLVQEKATGVNGLGDLLGEEGPCPDCRSDVSVPLATEEHVPVLEGRYPGGTFELTELWPAGE